METNSNRIVSHIKLYPGQPYFTLTSPYSLIYFLVGQLHSSSNCLAFYISVKCRVQTSKVMSNIYKNKLLEPVPRAKSKIQPP